MRCLEIGWPKPDLPAVVSAHCAPITLAFPVVHCRTRMCLESERKGVDAKDLEATVE